MLKRITTTLFALVTLAFAALAPMAAQAGAFTDYWENKTIDHMLRGQAFTPPATLYIGLDTVACTEAGGGTEVSGGSYARAPVAASMAAWAGTQSAGSTTASSGTSGTTSNNGVISFPTPTADWGQVHSFRVWDAPSAGNAILCQTLTLPKTINNGDAAPSFGAGALTIQVDN